MALMTCVHVCLQVVVAKTYTDFTARRVLTTEWLDGEKLSQSDADDVGTLVNLGVICYLKQLLDTGFFHAGAAPPITPTHARTGSGADATCMQTTSMSNSPSSALSSAIIELDLMRTQACARAAPAVATGGCHLQPHLHNGHRPRAVAYASAHATEVERAVRHCE